MFALQNTVIPGALIIRSSFINNTSEVSRKKKLLYIRKTHYKRIEGIKLWTYISQNIDLSIFTTSIHDNQETGRKTRNQHNTPLKKSTFQQTNWFKTHKNEEKKKTKINQIPYRVGPGSPGASRWRERALHQRFRNPPPQPSTSSPCPPPYFPNPNPNSSPEFDRRKRKSERKGFGFRAPGEAIPSLFIYHW